MPLDEVLKQIHKLKSIRHLETPRGALDRCVDVSRWIKNRLQKAGIESTVYRLVYFKGNPAKAQPEWQAMMRDDWTHYVVRIGDKFYDWTARQFDPDAAFPLVLTEDEIMYQWMFWRPADFS